MEWEGGDWRRLKLGFLIGRQGELGIEEMGKEGEERVWCTETGFGIKKTGQQGECATRQDGLRWWFGLCCLRTLARFLLL